MHLADTKFEAKFDLGPFITIIGFAITQLIIVGGFVWYASAWKAEVDIRIAQNTADIASQTSQAIARQASLAPRVDALERANDIQDERLGNITDGNKRRDEVLDRLNTNVIELTRNVAILTERLPSKTH